MVAACRADFLWHPSGTPGPFHTSCRSPVRFGQGFDTRRIHDLLRNSRYTCQQKQRAHVPKEHGTRSRDAVSVSRGRLLDVLDEKHQDAAGYLMVGPERDDRPSCRSRPHLQQNRQPLPTLPSPNGGDAGSGTSSGTSRRAQTHPGHTAHNRDAEACPWPRAPLDSCVRRNDGGRPGVGLSCPLPVAHTSGDNDPVHSPNRVERSFEVQGIGNLNHEVEDRLLIFPGHNFRSADVGL